MNSIVAGAGFWIRFQAGCRHQVGRNGVRVCEMVDVLLERLRAFPRPTRHELEAVRHLEIAKLHLEEQYREAERRVH